MAQTVKSLPAMQETWVRSLGREGPLEEGIANHPRILAWKIPGTEEPGGYGVSKSGTQLSDYFHYRGGVVVEGKKTGLRAAPPAIPQCLELPKWPQANTPTCLPSKSEASRLRLDARQTPCRRGEMALSARPPPPPVSWPCSCGSQNTGSFHSEVCLTPGLL